MFVGDKDTIRWNEVVKVCLPDVYRDLYRAQRLFSVRADLFVGE